MHVARDEASYSQTHSGQITGMVIRGDFLCSQTSRIRRVVCDHQRLERMGGGGHLEPDIHFGSAYSNATARAVAPVVEKPGAIHSWSPRPIGRTTEQTAEFAAVGNESLAARFIWLHSGNSAGENTDFSSIASAAKKAISTRQWQGRSERGARSPSFWRRRDAWRRRQMKSVCTWQLSLVKCPGDSKWPASRARRGPWPAIRRCGWPIRARSAAVRGGIWAGRRSAGRAAAALAKCPTAIRKLRERILDKMRLPPVPG